jgi:hypothetical protein
MADMSRIYSHRKGATDISHSGAGSNKDSNSRGIKKGHIGEIDVNLRRNANHLKQAICQVRFSRDVELAR